MPLACPRCAAAIPPAEVNPELMLARCPRCDVVVELGVVSSASAAPSEPAEGALIPVPERVDVAESDGQLVITHRWWSATYLFLLLFAMFWNGFLVMWYSIAAASGEVMMMLFPLIHVAVGIGVGYTAVCGLVNRTKVTVADGRLKIEHGPLPWPGARDLPVGDLAQLHCEQHVKRNKNGTTVTWSVEATLRDGRGIRLLTGLDRLATARFYEKRVESFLGITDRSVPGEAAPGA